MPPRSHSLPQAISLHQPELSLQQDFWFCLQNNHSCLCQQAPHWRSLGLVSVFYQWYDLIICSKTCKTTSQNLFLEAQLLRKTSSLCIPYFNRSNKRSKQTKKTMVNLPGSILSVNVSFLVLHFQGNCFFCKGCTGGYAYFLSAISSPRLLLNTDIKQTYTV